MATVQRGKLLSKLKRCLGLLGPVAGGEFSGGEAQRGRRGVRSGGARDEAGGGGGRKGRRGGSRREQAEPRRGLGRSAKKRNDFLALVGK